jgi:hypothetical protein
MPTQEPPVVVNHVEAAKAADVTVNVPEQPTPTVNVAPAVVHVTNEAQKAALVQDIRIVSMPESVQKVKRDAQGRITEIVEE